MSVIREIGEIMQLGYVPADFDATLEFWIKTMGAGPFYVMQGRLAETSSHRGKDSNPDLTIALGYWDDMQIEIMRQNDDTPSLYREWREADGQGLHHICVLTDDMDRARTIMTAAGAEIIFEGSAIGAAWFYADTGGGPGTMVEVSRQSQQSAALMAMIRDASRAWDGSDPIRFL